MATPAQVAANQANSQSSTGPNTSGGKARSSRNSFKHGLYAKDLVLPGENPAELDQLRASLRAEHQPANTTEEMLVNELAENFWRIRRMREIETRAMRPENIITWHDSGLLTVVHRTMGSAQREFHRALTALRRLQKDRGFLPQSTEQPVTEPGQLAPEIGFVPSKAQESSPGIIFLDPNSEAFYRETGFRTAEELRAHCLSQFDKHSEAA